MVKDNSYGIAPLQNKMLDILKHFIAFCEDNNLKYFACGGTCIGALRHGGFIPWDDDLDVFMPRSDYEKLWEIYDNKKNSKFMLCRTTAEKNYHHRVMQMVDLETTFINKRSQNEDIEHGVYIDIIPLDVCPNSPIKRLSQIIYSVLFSVYNIQCVPEFNGGKLMRTAVKAMLFIIKDNEKRIKIWQKAEKKMIKSDQENSNRIVELTTNLKALLHPHPKEWFEFTGRKAKFEDIEINIFDKAELYLKNVFGDYMQFPPEKDRHPRHNTVHVDLDNSYLNYKGKYYCIK